MRTLDEKLRDADLGVCIPLVLLLNFSLFQYLLTTYHRRCHEGRVKLLLGIAFVSFACLVPFALPGDNHSRNLNAISEVCSVLTCLLQITVLTRDVTKRIRIVPVLRLMWCAELLVLASLSVLVLNAVDLVAPLIDMELVELLDNIVEHAALVFIVGFRFYFLGIAKGFHKAVATPQKTEIVLYLLFLTHEIPFHVLAHWTRADWHHVQGLWMRVTIAMCLALTIRSKLSKQSSKKGLDTGVPGPFKSQVDHTSYHHQANDPLSAKTGITTTGKIGVSLLPTKPSPPAPNK